MIAKGIFDARQRQRLELIDGEILKQAPIGPDHEDVVDRLSAWSIRRGPREDVHVRNQHSVGLAEVNSVPEPDIAWVRRNDYHRRRPQATDVFLVIEVAAKSLAFDRNIKGTLYAKTGIADYWIVNVRNRCVEVYREPTRGRYTSRETYSAGDTVSPLAFPKIALPVKRLFP